MIVWKYASCIYVRIVAAWQGLFVNQQAAHYIGAQVAAGQIPAANNTSENKLFS